MQSVEKKVRKAIERCGIKIYYSEDNTFTALKGIVVLQGKNESETDTVFGKSNAANYRLFATEDHYRFMKRGARFDCSLGNFIVGDFVEVVFQNEVVCFKAVGQNLSWEEKYDN